MIGHTQSSHTCTKSHDSESNPRFTILHFELINADNRQYSSANFASGTQFTHYNFSTKK